MVKTFCTILGAVFMLIGLIGFFVPEFLCAHLSPVHNLIHLGSGALALYFGLKATPTAALMFCRYFGGAYALLGLIGLLLGTHGTATVAPLSHDQRLFTVIPGALELGTIDHTVHLAFGVAFLLFGFLPALQAKPVVGSGDPASQS